VRLGLRCSTLLAGILLSGFLFRADALDPRTELSQYLHSQWGTEQGFIWGPVHAFAQTPDGYLWIGTEKGLVRFDGSTFQLFNHSNSPALPMNAVFGLTTDAEGSLWIRLQSPTLLRYRAGRFDAPLPNLSPADTSTTAMFSGAGGDLLIAYSNRLLTYARGKFTNVPAATDDQNLLVMSIAESPDGSVWLGTRDSGLYLLRKNEITNITKGLPDRKVNSVIALRNDELWAGTDGGVVGWNGKEVTSAGIPGCLRNLQALAMLRDQDSNIWVATHDGLMRVTPDGTCSAAPPSDQSDDSVSALFEDSDGNIWAGNSEGIERFRETLFTTHTIAKQPYSEDMGPLAVDSEGRTWFAPSEGGLYWFKEGRAHQISVDGLNKDVVYSLAATIGAGGQSEIWVGRQRGGLTHLQFRNGVPVGRAYTAPPALAGTSISALHLSGDGSVWAGSLDSGVRRLRIGKFDTFNSLNGLASNSLKAIAEAPDHTMWFAGPAGLTRLVNGRWRTFTSADGLPPGNISCLYGDSAGVLWVGTERGLAYIESGEVKIPEGVPHSLSFNVTRIAEDRFGWLWITTANSVLRVKRDAFLRNHLTDADVREFGPNDGLRAAGGVRAMVTDNHGRVWLSLHDGLSVIDPVRLNRPSARGAARIVTFSAAGKSLDLNPPISIPGNQQRIAIEFGGLSLSAPERIRFRYRLDGFDKGWSEPAYTRQAVYTNLNPGPYRFRVIASNADGLWNSAETHIDFSIEPAFWQTWWFRMLAILTAAGIVAAAYQYRLRQVKWQMNLRFEDQLSERIRIAQELHDTLLQGVISASMLLHVAADELPPESVGKRKLTRVLALMGDVMEEGRRALRGLRAQQTSSFDLDQAFKRIREELSMDESIEFRVAEEGRRRQLHPTVRDDVYRIGREALVNAYRHSGATVIEVEMEYGSRSFSVFVRDDGCGIGPEVLRSGLEGHWGLIGMRERAERIGGRLNIWSREAGGTEIRLCIPNRIAFENYQSTDLWKKLAGFCWPKSKDNELL
jgi:signal transduction histidine kinase/ligand-binding sensor domain-containing protein